MPEAIRTARRPRFSAVSAVLLLCPVAFLPRLIAIGRYVTPDEMNWVYRSLGMRRALLSADWAHTIQSGHPGVTTTWFGAVAMQIQLWLQPPSASHLAWLQGLRQLSTENVEAYRHLYVFLRGGRIGLALVTSLGILLIYLLAREVFGRRAAFLGAFLLALDPFFAGLSGLLHVDGLLATFTLLALLSALRALQARPLFHGALAGLFTALALLTKTPGVVLLGFAPAILLWPLARRPAARVAGARTEEPEEPGSRRTWRRTLSSLFVYSLAFSATLLLLLPALVANPGGVVDAVLGLSGRLLEDAVRPSFFLGRTALDHGPLYYPLAVLLRLSPPVTLGLIAALALVAARERKVSIPHSGGALALLLFSLAFLFAISLAARKFDRYALPALVPLALVAAWGFTAWAARSQARSRTLLAFVLLLQVAYLAASLPHPLTAYNWLVGGRPVARRVLPVGWGEDAGAAARWLSRTLPESQTATLYTTNLTGTAPFFPGEIVRLEPARLTRLQQEDYLLLLAQKQQGTSAALGRQTPRRRLQVAGVGRVALYSGLQATDLALPPFHRRDKEVTVGGALQLTAAGSAFLPWPEEALLGLVWQRLPQAQPSSSYRLQVLLADDADRIWMRREYLLLNQSDRAPLDWQSGAPQPVFYTLSVPPDLAPGEYRLVARVFDEEGRQLAMFDGAGRFAGIQAPLASLPVEAPAAQPPLEIPQRLGAEDPVAGYGSLPATAYSGAPLALDLWWKAQEATTYRLLLQVAGHQAVTELDTEGWPADHVFHVRPTWRLPPDVPPGSQTLWLQVQDGQGRSLWPEPLLLGDLQVVAWERHYEMPAGVEPLRVQIGDVATLQQATARWQDGALLVDVIWQARKLMDRSYTTFVHLRDEEGQTVAQVDRPPEPPTDHWLPGQVVRETYKLVPPVAPQGASYSLAMGLYNPLDGQRLPLRSAAGAPLSDDAYLLEVGGP